MDWAAESTISDQQWLNRSENSLCHSPTNLGAEGCSGSQELSIFHSSIPGQAILRRPIMSRSKTAAATLGIMLTSPRRRKGGRHDRPRAHDCRSLPPWNAFLEGAAGTSSCASLAGTGHVTANNSGGSSRRPGGQEKPGAWHPAAVLTLQGGLGRE